MSFLFRMILFGHKTYDYIGTQTRLPGHTTVTEKDMVNILMELTQVLMEVDHSQIIRQLNIQLQLKK